MAETLRQAYWNLFPVDRVKKEVDWTGDDALNRIIPIGLATFMVFVVPRSAFSDGSSHLACAYAFGDAFGVFYSKTENFARHAANGHADCTTRWQGIVGTDLKLGSAIAASGTNALGVLYRATCFVLREDA